MAKPKILKVKPMERFRIRVSGKLRVGPWDVKFARKSRYYQCPKCAARTLIRWRKLDILGGKNGEWVGGGTAT